jgi:hypothetical protein
VAGGGDVRSYSELQEIVRSANLVRVAGASTFRNQLTAEDGAVLNLSTISEVLEVSRENQTMTVQGGFVLDRFGEPELFNLGLYIPHPVFMPGFEFDAIGFDHSVSELLSVNVPHLWESARGSWRDWIIGMKLLLADGSIVTTGSKVVKSVSGFDLHKLVIGSRFTIAIPLEITFKLSPIDRKSLAKQKDWGEDVEILSGQDLSGIPVIQRVPPEQLRDARSAFAGRLVAVDKRAGLLFGTIQDDSQCPSVGSVYIANGKGVVSGVSPQTQALMRRTKQLFDPTNKLNPGEFGFL